MSESSNATATPLISAPRRLADTEPPSATPTKPPKSLRPPRRLPKPKVPLAPLTAGQVLLRSSLAMVVVVVVAFLANLVGLSHLQHAIAQQQLHATYAEELAAGTAPVSEGDFADVLLADGVPVARIEIPAIGVNEIVVEGTASGDLAKGPGHRRDTILPGQAGVSVIMGRSSAYGGPFGRLQELPPGESISVITGQGEQLYRILGVRYAGDPAPAPITAGQSRLILETTRGGPYSPAGILRVDAELVTQVQAPGARQTSHAMLPVQDRELAGDTTTVWALIFALQFLIVAEIAAIWSFRRFGTARTWVVLVPVLLLAGLLVADQLNRLLPNLL